MVVLRGWSGQWDTSLAQSQEFLLTGSLAFSAVLYGYFGCFEYFLHSDCDVVEQKINTYVQYGKDSTVVRFDCSESIQEQLEQEQEQQIPCMCDGETSGRVNINTMTANTNTCSN